MGLICLAGFSLEAMALLVGCERFVLVFAMIYLGEISIS